MKCWGAVATILIGFAHADAFLVGGDCPQGRVPIACTTRIPPSCFCSGFPPAVPKPLPPACFCGVIGRAPVCGRDGRTYNSRCEADCAKTAVACEGECPCKRPKPPPTDIFSFDLFKCQDAGRSASFAAARAACSTLKSKCPANPPNASRFAASGAALSADASFAIPERIRKLIEKAIAEVCRGIAESTCRNNAFSQVQDADCRKILSTGPAVSVPGCRSQQDARKIFDSTVNELCQG